MPIAQTDLLFKLIKSLTKAEKRHFSLYLKRVQQEGEVKFIQLFDILEKQDAYDEKSVLEKLQPISKSQYTNLKRHLYQHLLTSLRLINVRKHFDIQIRELMDFAHILYGKGLYYQALKILNRAKDLARKKHQDLLHLEIIEFEKRIESRHITRSTTERMTDLTAESARRNRITSNIVALSNLKLQLQRYFINNGHVRNQLEHQEVERAYQDHFRHWGFGQLTFFEKIYLHQASYWLHYILLDLDRCHFYASKWVALFKSEPNMIEEDIDIYLKGLYHLMTISYFRKDLKGFDLAFKEIQHFQEMYFQKLNENSKIFFWLYFWQAKLNECFLKGQFEEGIKLVPTIEKKLENIKHLVDLHKLHVFYFKFGWMFLAGEQPEKAIDYLNKILSEKEKLLRKEIHGYARLIFFMAHYDLNNRDIFDYLLNSTSRFFSKLDRKEQLQKISLQFFKQIMALDDHRVKEKFESFYQELNTLENDPFERRSFIFLDLPTWIESKLAKKTMSQIVQQRLNKPKEQLLSKPSPLK